MEDGGYMMPGEGLGLTEPGSWLLLAPVVFLPPRFPFPLPLEAAGESEPSSGEELPPTELLVAFLLRPRPRFVGVVEPLSGDAVVTCWFTTFGEAMSRL